MNISTIQQLYMQDGLLVSRKAIKSRQLCTVTPGGAMIFLFGPQDCPSRRLARGHDMVLKFYCLQYSIQRLETCLYLFFFTSGPIALVGY